MDCTYFLAVERACDLLGRIRVRLAPCGWGVSYLANHPAGISRVDPICHHCAVAPHAREGQSVTYMTYASCALLRDVTAVADVINNNNLPAVLTVDLRQSA